VQLEGVRSEAVGLISLQVLGKVDNIDGLKRTLLDANSATNAKLLRDEGNLGQSRTARNHEIEDLHIESGITLP
jgi:hypothetical protein